MTRIVPEKKRQGLYGFLRDTVKSGQQVYVVCPLVEESEVVDAASAERTAKDLGFRPAGRARRAPARPA